MIRFSIAESRTVKNNSNWFIAPSANLAHLYTLHFSSLFVERTQFQESSVAIGFYLRFIEPNRRESKGIWEQLSQTPSARAWSGFAFENICFTHVPQIKDALGISGIFSTVSAFYRRVHAEHRGIQIDMLIDRSDKVINLLEIKFLSDPWAIDKTDLARIREKTALFKSLTATRKMVQWVALSTFGVMKNPQSTAAFAQTLSAEVLFMAE